MNDQTQMQLVDWLDDLTVRFLLNLPASELSHMPRLCFQVEEAQWFYEDFIRPVAAAAGNPLPSLALRQFCLLLFKHCPLLQGFSDAQLVNAYESFLAYKVRVPVRGAILMTWDMEKVLLVKGWKKGASWSFPRGKINQEEKDLDCAIREVYEETGYDVRQAGLVPENEKESKYISVDIREQNIQLFVVRGVPEETYFEPRTRKEISKIQWYNIRDLPGFRKQKSGQEQVAHANKFYMVAPFLGPLKKWINQQKRKDAALLTSDDPTALLDDGFTDGQVPEPALPPPDDKSAEPRDLLSSAGVSQASHYATAGQQVDGSANLLALLQGHATQNTAPAAVSSNVPPLGRVSHAQHLRNTSSGQAPLMSNQYGGHYDPAWQTQQLPYRQPVSQPFNEAPNPNMVFGSQMPFPSQYQHSERLNHITPQTQWQHAQPHQAVEPQGVHGAINEAPEAPKANTLPMPKLTAHSMNLLNAFRSGPPGQSAPQSQNSRNPRESSLHQSALLDLFKKDPMQTQQEQQSDRAPAASSEKPLPQPTADAGAVSPDPLPIKPIPAPKSIIEDNGSRKGKPKRIRANVDNRPPSQSVETAGSRKASRTTPDAVTQRLAPAFTILQRPSTSLPPSPASNSPAPRSPKTRQNPSPKINASPKINSSPKVHGQSKRSETHTPTAPFAILARPGSARGSPSQTNHGSKPAFQPQLLKRTETPTTSTPLSEPQSRAANSDQLEGTKDKLLALFGKVPPVQENPSAPPNAAAKANESPTVEKVMDQRKTNLLNLLGATNQVPPTRPTSSAVPSTPSPGVGAVPETKTHSGVLLDIFKQPSKTVLPQLGEHDLAKAPTAHGNPVAESRPFSQTWQSSASQHIRPFPEPKPRLSSVDSTKDALPLSGHVTPTESKGFLLNFLNGVVQQEAQRRKI